MSEFIKYGTDPRMDALVDSNDYVDHRIAAEQGYGLEKLIRDPAWEVRRAVARQGYDLDKLINDENIDVRIEVVKQGYGLDILINDEEWKIRRAVANQGYGLDILINDKSDYVRCAVAKQGYGLDILINDKDTCTRKNVAEYGYGLDKLINDEHDIVRSAVAERGYGLNKLINDRHFYVRYTVKEYLKKHNYKSIADWAAANPDKIHKADAQDFEVREDLKDFIYKIDDSPKLKVESSYDDIDEFFNDCSSSSNDPDELIICTVDTRQPIIKIQKALKENKTEFKFIVDITDENGDRFLIQTTIKSKEQLNSKIQETVESLKPQKEFSKYADDLEACLS